MKLDRIASGDFFKSSGTYMEKMIPAQGSKSGGGLLSGGTDGSFKDTGLFLSIAPETLSVDGRRPSELTGQTSTSEFSSFYSLPSVPLQPPKSFVMPSPLSLSADGWRPSELTGQTAINSGWSSSGNNLDTSQFVDGRIPAISSGWSSSGNNLDTSQFVRTRNPDLNEEELRETIEEWMGSGYGSAGNNFLTDEEKQKIVQEAVNNWRPWWRSINPDTSQFVRTMTVDPDDELFATKRKWIQFADKDRKKYSPFFSKNHKVRKSIVG